MYTRGPVCHSLPNPRVTYWEESRARVSDVPLYCSRKKKGGFGDSRPILGATKVIGAFS